MKLAFLAVVIVAGVVVAQVDQGTVDAAKTRLAEKQKSATSQATSQSLEVDRLRDLVRVLGSENTLLRKQLAEMQNQLDSLRMSKPTTRAVSTQPSVDPTSISQPKE